MSCALWSVETSVWFSELDTPIVRRQTPLAQLARRTRRVADSGRPKTLDRGTVMIFIRVFPAILVCFACGGGEGSDESGGSGGKTAGSGGASQPGSGGGIASGGKTSSAAGMTAGGSITATAGSSSGKGGSNSANGGASAAGGSTGSAGKATGTAGASAGGVPNTPPGPGADGLSPYSIACHGNSLDCADPALRCLGIRDGTGIFGYSCSNVCTTANDCSTVSSGAEAAAGCVPFTTESHCLLVCQDDTGQKACPNGMSCYVYPGTTIGYCLWR